MIKIDKHEVFISGEGNVVCAEIARGLRAVCSILEKHLGKDEAWEIIDTIAARAKMSKEEAHAEAVEELKKTSKEDELRHLMERIAKAIRGEDEE